MTEPVHTPDVDTVLDWDVRTRGDGTKPLRHLTADELLWAAGFAAATGDPWLADTFATVAEEVLPGTVVGDLDPTRFHELFWGIASPTVTTEAHA